MDEKRKKEQDMLDTIADAEMRRRLREEEERKAEEEEREAHERYEVGTSHVTCLYHLSIDVGIYVFIAEQYLTS